MGLRFRRSLKLAPGIRLNFSGSGLSWTLGPRGASVSVGRRGTFLNSSIPGTGLYSRQRLSGTSPRSRDAPKMITMSATVSVSDEGVVTFKDANGTPLSDYLVKQATKQNADSIKGLIEGKVTELNASVDALGEVHLSTPSPVPAKYEQEPFQHPRPTEPQPTPITFLARLFRKRRERIEAANAIARAEYERQLAAWERAVALHRKLEEQKRKRYEDDVRVNVEVMERVLEECVQDIPWPRETNISFDVLNQGRAVVLDVDLPEIEDMPTKRAAVTGRGFEIKFAEAPGTKLRQLYMRHVHGVGFRLIGEVFARLPLCEEVTLSAFSQRPDKQTGGKEDQYLYSVRVKRRDWGLIDFANLDHVDVTAAFERFELRRKMTKTGVFQPIEPFAGRT